MLVNKQLGWNVLIDLMSEHESHSPREFYDMAFHIRGY
jgi:hypothetical protein